MAVKAFIALLAGASAASAGVIDYSIAPRQASSSLDSCPGYTASSVVTNGDQIVSADLTLAGAACNAYGTDLTDLTLTVEYQTSRSRQTFAITNVH